MVQCSRKERGKVVQYRGEKKCYLVTELEERKGESDSVSRGEKEKGLVQR